METETDAWSASITNQERWVVAREGRQDPFQASCDEKEWNDNKEVWQPKYDPWTYIYDSNFRGFLPRICKENEAKAWKYIKKTINSQLDKYPTSFK